jgi:hypothetical protein
MPNLARKLGHDCKLCKQCKPKVEMTLYGGTERFNIMISSS